jgi:hypothetical protein
MKLREVVKALRRHGCTPQGGKEHEKWVCPCGEHSANISRRKVISPGVVGCTSKRMACLPEGWLQ